jgi:hypothetical protein
MVLRMGAVTRRFLAIVNYRGNSALPLFPRYPQSSSSSASTGRSQAAPSSSSWPPFQPSPTHPPFRMSLLGGLLSEVLRLHVHPHQEGQDRHHEDPHLHQHQHQFLPHPSAMLFSHVLTTTL